MKLLRLLLAGCFAASGPASAQAQEVSQLTRTPPAYVSKTKPSAAKAGEGNSDPGRLKQRRSALRYYLSTVAPSSADYEATEREIRELSLRIAAAEAEKLTPAASPVAAAEAVVPAPARRVRQETIEDIFDDFFDDLAAALAAACPTPTVTNFELAYGYDQRLSARNNDQGPRTMRGPLSFSYFPNNRFTFGVGFDTFSSRTAPDTERVTGVGNASLNFSYRVAPEGASPLPLSLDYSLTIPSASVAKGLGRGRFDHLITGTVPKSFGPAAKCSQRKVNRLTFTPGGLFAGRRQADGYSGVGLMTIGYDRFFGLTGKHRFHAEVTGSSRSGTINADAFALGFFQFQTSKNTSVRIGTRAGIAPNSPRFGFFARFGVTGDLGEIFKVN